MNINNFDRFCDHLKSEYRKLFQTPEYSYSASKTTPEALALKMTEGLRSGQANKDGLGIRRTCKALKIKNTYQDIRDFLVS